LPDLGWIVAVEALIPPGIEVFKGAYSPGGIVLFIFVFAARRWPWGHDL